MGWLIAIPMFIAGCWMGNDTVIITSAIFAVAGSISHVATAIMNKNKSDEKKQDE